MPIHLVSYDIPEQAVRSDELKNFLCEIAGSEKNVQPVLESVILVDIKDTNKPFASLFSKYRDVKFFITKVMKNFDHWNLDKEAENWIKTHLELSANCKNVMVSVKLSELLK